MQENYQWQIAEYGLETRGNNDEYFTEYSIHARELFDIIERDEICIFRAMPPLLGREWVIGDSLIEIHPNAVQNNGKIFPIEFGAGIIDSAMEFLRANDCFLKSREICNRLKDIA